MELGEKTFKTKLEAFNAFCDFAQSTEENYLCGLWTLIGPDNYNNLYGSEEEDVAPEEVDEDISEYMDYLQNISVEDFGETYDYVMGLSFFEEMTQNAPNIVRTASGGVDMDERMCETLEKLNISCMDLDDADTWKKLIKGAHEETNPYGKTPNFDVIFPMNEMIIYECGQVFLSYLEEFMSRVEKE